MSPSQVVLITGAAGNLGATTARAFRRAGTRTVLVDRSLAHLREDHADLEGSPEHLLIGDLDLSDEASFAGVVRRAEAELGPVDVLVTTVGTYRAGKRVHEDDLDTWDLLFRLNVRTALVACRAVLPGMLARRRGRIVTVGSRDALAGVAGAAAYGASKAALLRLTESVAEEARGHGVTANCVLPGAIDTPQNRTNLAEAERGRLVSPDAIADVILFLASAAARAVTGAALPIEGGS